MNDPLLILKAVAYAGLNLLWVRAVLRSVKRRS